MTIKYVQSNNLYLAGSGVVIGATSITVTSLTDIYANVLTMTDFGSKGYVTLEPDTSNEEAATFTGITANSNGTYTLTGVKTALAKSPYTEISGLIRQHSGGTKVVITDNTAFWNTFTNKNNDETIDGQWTFNNTPIVPGTVSDASTTVKGVSKTSVAPATANDPIVVGTNDPRVPVAYAVDSVGTDAYAITPSPAETAYVTGKEYTFKAGTANTGAATLNVNSLGAKTIKKDVSTDLATGDILANQIVTVKYDGTNFQMTSLVAGAKDATKFTGILPVVNGGTGLATAAVPFFQQFMAISSSDLGTYYGLTGSNSDGSVIVVYKTNAKLTRYARDTNTGIYMYTHEINPALSINGNESSMIIIGSYIYIFSASTNIVCTRFLLADLTGETTMSVPTTAATTASAWTNGTDAYVVSNTTSTTSRKWTISGTTMSEASTATCTSTVSNNGQAQSSIWDGTNPYIVRKTGTTEITVYKLSDIIGTSVSSTTSSWTDSMGDSPVGCYAASIDSTKMYFGYSYDIYNASALDHQELTLIPITKP